MQVAVKIKLEQHRRVIRRSAGIGTTGFGKSQRRKIQRPDERVQESHRVLGGNVFLQPFGKKQRL